MKEIAMTTFKGFLFLVVGMKILDLLGDRLVWIPLFFIMSFLFGMMLDAAFKVEH